MSCRIAKFYKSAERKCPGRRKSQFFSASSCRLSAWSDLWECIISRTTWQILVWCYIRYTYKKMLKSHSFFSQRETCTTQDWFDKVHLPNFSRLSYSLSTYPFSLRNWIRFCLVNLNNNAKICIKIINLFIGKSLGVGKVQRTACNSRQKMCSIIGFNSIHPSSAMFPCRVGFLMGDVKWGDKLNSVGYINVKSCHKWRKSYLTKANVGFAWFLGGGDGRSANKGETLLKQRAGYLCNVINCSCVI